MIEALVILDSLAPNGARLITFQLTYPRFIHSELMTHRVFSRNAASSRAIPTHKKIERIQESCAYPSEWGKNQKGMQSAGPIDPLKELEAIDSWDRAASFALTEAGILDILGVHKQVANRILEPFDHITTVVTTTKTKNHRKLRTDAAADPTYRELAIKMHAAEDASTPKRVEVGQWHLPYITAQDWEEHPGYKSHEDLWADESFVNLLKKVSVGRVARTSYLRQGQGDIAENVALHDRLASSGHWSPFEAVATPIGGFELVTFQHELAYCLDSPNGSYAKCIWCYQKQKHDAMAVLINADVVCMKCAQGHITSGNFHGWKQYRKEFDNESGGD